MQSSRSSRRKCHEVPIRARRRQSDARWRANVASCFETLKHIIPVNKRASKRQISKASILQETSKHLTFLEGTLVTLLQEKAKNAGHEDLAWCRSTFQGIRTDFVERQKEKIEALNNEKKYKRNRYKLFVADNMVPPSGRSSSLPAKRCRSRSRSQSLSPGRNIYSPKRTQAFRRSSSTSDAKDKTKTDIKDLPQQHASALVSIPRQVKKSKKKTEADERLVPPATDNDSKEESQGAAQNHQMLLTSVKQEKSDSPQPRKNEKQKLKIQRDSIPEYKKIIPYLDKLQMEHDSKIDGNHSNTLKPVLSDTGVRGKKWMCRGRSLPRLCGRVIVIAPRRVALDGRGRRAGARGGRGGRKSYNIGENIVVKSEIETSSEDRTHLGKESHDTASNTLTRRIQSTGSLPITPLKRHREDHIEGTPHSKRIHSPSVQDRGMNPYNGESSQSDNNFTPIKQKKEIGVAVAGSFTPVRLPSDLTCHHKLLDVSPVTPRTECSSDGEWETSSSLMCDEEIPSDPEDKNNTASRSKARHYWYKRGRVSKRRTRLDTDPSEQDQQPQIKKSGGKKKPYVAQQLIHAVVPNTSPSVPRCRRSLNLNGCEDFVHSSAPLLQLTPPPTPSKPANNDLKRDINTYETAGEWSGEKAGEEEVPPHINELWQQLMSDQPPSFCLPMHVSSAVPSPVTPQHRYKYSADILRYSSHNPISAATSALCANSGVEDIYGEVFSSSVPTNCLPTDKTKSSPPAENEKQYGEFQSLETFSSLYTTMGTPSIDREVLIQREGEMLHQGGSFSHGETLSCGGSFSQGETLSCGGSFSQGETLNCGDSLSQGKTLICGGSFSQGETLSCGDSLSQGEILSCGDSLSQGEILSCGDSLSQGEILSCGDSLSQGEILSCGDSLSQGEILSCGDSLSQGEILSCGDYLTQGEILSCGDSFSQDHIPHHGAPLCHQQPHGGALSDDLSDINVTPLHTNLLINLGFGVESTADRQTAESVELEDVSIGDFPYNTLDLNATDDTLPSSDTSNDSMGKTFIPDGEAMPPMQPLTDLMNLEENSQMVPALSPSYVVDQSLYPENLNLTIKQEAGLENIPLPDIDIPHYPFC